MKSAALQKALTHLRDELSAQEHDEFGEVRLRYQQDPVAFIQEVIGVDPYDYQKRCIRNLLKYKREAVKSLHGVGKTAMAAWIVLWVFACFEGEVKVVMTASAWLQLSEYLLPEVKKWALRADWGKVGMVMRENKEILERSLKYRNKRAFATSPDRPSSIEGAHAQTLLYVFDESKAIPDEIWDAVEGAFANEDKEGYHAFAFAISTPGQPLGRFYDIHKRRAGTLKWHTDNITLAEAIAAGQVSAAWAEEKRELWGEDDARYINRVLGGFAEGSDTSLYRLSWIEAAFDRWRACQGKGDADNDPVYGSDVADDGRDLSTIGRLRGNVVEHLEAFDCDTMELVDRLVKHIGNEALPRVVVDANGVGAGTYSRLKQLKRYKLVKFKGSYAAKRADGKPQTDSTGELKFNNLRSLSMWMLREWLDPNSPAYNELALPPSEDLESELLAIDWQEANGVIRIEDKEAIRKKLGGKSTDLVDTVSMMVWAQAGKRSISIRRL